MARRAGSVGSLRVIALEQSLGGGLGILYVLAWLAVGEAGLPLALALSLHGASLLGGLWLWRGIDRGVALSLLVQILQLPALQLSFLVYRFWSGFSVGLVLDFAERQLDIQLGLGAEWQIEPSPEVAGPLFVGIDVVAAVMARILWQELRRRRGWAPISLRSPRPPPGTPAAPRRRRRAGSPR
jgi:hypothetical protein